MIVTFSDIFLKKTLFSFLEKQQQIRGIAGQAQTAERLLDQNGSSTAERKI